MARAPDRRRHVSTYVIACDRCGIRMIVTDRRLLLCDECADDDRQSDTDHIPPWQVHG